MKVLDCTLRDGGYVNNWNFGAETKTKVLHGLEEIGVDIIELGFMRDNPYNPDSSNITRIEEANELIQPKKEGVIYSAMLEAFSPYPLEKLSDWTPDGVDLIRVCIWKRMMDEHMDYIKQVVDKGYKISVQPSRVEQYNETEFVDMLKRSNELHPYSVYVVDTWGTQSSHQIVNYIKLADEYLDSDIKIGYHGHNNRMQALSCVQAVAELKLHHELAFDASLYGMGRGAGNLNTEILLQYLNEYHGRNYDLQKAVKLAEDTVMPIHGKTPWGYSLYYYLSSNAGCNPNFALYFSEHGYSVSRFSQFLSRLTEKEKIVCTADFIENKLIELGI